MTLTQSILLGVIQGATEFIPISSSGHLVVAPLVLGWSFQPQEAFIFDVLVQVATLLAVIVYFWKDLHAIADRFLHDLACGKPFQSAQARLGWYLILATIPAGAAALAFKETFEKAFSDPRAAAFFLFGTSALLLAAELVKKRLRGVEDIGWADALVIGCFQVIALFPGISRSGATISAGMFRGLKRPAAARFSFLMAVPVMTAAGVLAAADLAKYPQLWERIPVYSAGFLAAAVVGYLAIHWLIRFLSRKSLLIFALYCAVLGGSILFFYY